MPTEIKREGSTMRKLIMEKAAIKNNLSIIKDKADGAAVYGVLTGDGCGAGIVPMADRKSVV